MKPIELYTGDCLDVLRTITSSSVDLVYLDPPFFTQRVQRLSTRDGSKEYSFDDIWKSYSEYGDFLLSRVTEMARCLKQTGSIFFHCNERSSHIARLVLDEVFGADMFQSEIVWSYRRWSNSQKGLLPGHQTILFYAKSREFKFNLIQTSYSESTNIDQVLQRRIRDTRGKAVYDRDANGQVVSSGQKRGVPLSDVWEIPYLNPKAKERVGYPTQKPILLLEKIIQLCTDLDDMVLDPFCGSGTTLVAAQLNDRNGIGIDQSLDAIQLAKQRLANPVKTSSELLDRGREEYLRTDMDVLDVLKGIDFFPVQRNKGIDAILKQEYGGRPVLVRIQRKAEPLHDAIAALLRASQEKGNPKLIVIATSDVQQGLLMHYEEHRGIMIIPSAAMAINEFLRTAPDDSPFELLKSAVR